MKNDVHRKPSYLTRCHSNIVGIHSALRLILIKFQIPSTKLTKEKTVCFKGSKNVLHEILLKGHGRAVQASTANPAQIWSIGQN